MAKNITATANGTTVSGNNLKYVVSNLGGNIKSVTYNGTEYWKAEEYLLQNGVVQSLAGGFTHYAQQYNSALTYQNGYMELRNTNSGSYSLVRSNNQIPWGNYSKLYIQMAKTEIPYTDCRIALDKNGTSNIYRWMTSQDNNTMSLFTTYWTPNWPEDTIITIDVSGVYTSGWLMFGMTGNVGWWRMKNIWVE